MKLVMTMMVRDEVDIVSAVLEHHFDQGVDLVIVTDNASVDGTTEVLERYADLGLVELHHDPDHRKQQGEVVTRMAQRAFTEHGADWVINGDADEFVVARDRSLTVRQALERTPTAIGSFDVPVVNLVGPPAQRGSGLDRLVWRDHRSTRDLRAVGIPAQPTHNAIHIGDPEVGVAQGNHFVTIESLGEPPSEVALEVLHLPWRSWAQIEQKVLHAGRGYDANPDLRPSRNHHGMKDYRRAQRGQLREIFSLRMPLLTDLERDPSFERDVRLSESLGDLLDRAKAPDLLRDVLESGEEDLWTDDEHRRSAELGASYLARELADDRKPSQRLIRLASRARRGVRKVARR